jgi:hypothetical protein
MQASAAHALRAASPHGVALLLAGVATAVLEPHGEAFLADAEDLRRGAGRSVA